VYCCECCVHSNIKNAYTAESKPHFGKSFNLAILLKPTYFRRLKDNPVTTKAVNIWTDSALMNLLGYLEATNKNIFKEATDNIPDYSETGR